LAPDQSRISGASDVSIASSGSVASDFSSARCPGVSRLEVPFFIDSPFSRGGFAGADDATDVLAFVCFFRPGMNNQQQQRPDESDSAPAIAVGVWVRSRR